MRHGAADRLWPDHIATYVVARMIEMLMQQRDPARCWKSAPACGYQAAVLASLAAEVYSSSGIASCTERARTNLPSCG